MTVKDFQPVHFVATALRIGELHPTLQKKAMGDFTDKSREFLDESPGWNGEQDGGQNREFDRWSLTLTMDQLDLALFALKYCNKDLQNGQITRGRFQMLLRLLEQRGKPSQFWLCWYLLQWDYDNESLLHAFALLGRKMEEHDPNAYEKFRDILSKLDMHSVDYFEASASRQTAKDIADDIPINAPINSSNQPNRLKFSPTSEAMPQLLFKSNSYDRALKNIGGRLDLLPEAYLWRDFCNLWLGSCDVKTLILNIEVLVNLVNIHGLNGTVEAVNNYLRSEEPIRYDDALLNSISMLPADLGKLGADAFRQYTIWDGLKKIVAYFSGNNRAIEAIRILYMNINMVQEEPTSGSLFIYFQPAVLVACRSGDHYLVRRRTFELLYERYLADLTAGVETPFGKLFKDHVTARQAFLEDIVRDIYQVRFEDAGILYIKELLEKFPDLKG